MPLWPSFAQVMESAARRVRLSARAVRMSGRRAPCLIPIPTPERAIATRPRASTLPCFARSLSTAAGSMARSKAWPPSIWRFKAVARPKEMTSLCLVSRSKAGASSFSASLTPFEARTLISAAETEVVASMAAIAASALKFILSPSNFEQVPPERNPRAHQLVRDALAAIHDVGHAVRDDQVRRLRAPGRDDPRAAAGAEEDQPCLRLCRDLSAQGRERSSRRQCRRAGKKIPSR